MGARWEWDGRLEEMRGRWVRVLRERWPEVPLRWMEGAVREALALASCTGEPALVFPLLAEEKGAAVARWHARQRRMLGRRSSYFAE